MQETGSPLSKAVGGQVQWKGFLTAHIAASGSETTDFKGEVQ